MPLRASTARKLLKWLKRGEVVAAILVLLGVAGDVLVDKLIEEPERILEKARQSEREAERKAIADAEARAAEANEKAESERLARIKIEERMAQRHLSADFPAKLSGLGGWRVDVILLSGTSEASNFSIELGQALVAAHLDEANSKLMSGNASARGCVVQIDKGASDKVAKAAKQMMVALHSEGLLVGKNVGPKPPGIYSGSADKDAPIRIFIGDKR